MTSDWRRKLDPQARAALDAAALSGPVELLLGLDHPLRAEDRAHLEAAGLQLGAGDGRVVSGRLTDPAALADIAGAEFVRQVEVSRALGPERPPPPPTGTG